jgi:hypothetical protein
LIEGRVAHAALAPYCFERYRIDIVEWVGGFQQAAAARAIVDDFGNGEALAAALLEADKFGRHEVSIVAVQWPKVLAPDQLRHRVEEQLRAAAGRYQVISA